MLTRRHFLNGTLAAGLALATQRAQPLAAQPAQKPRRVIVDSQIHMWKANTPDRPWVPGTRPQLPEPMTIERVVPMIDAAGVDRVVIVPPTLEGERVDYGQEAARRYPGRFATMGHIALDNPGEARRLATWKQQPAVLGIRLNVANQQAKWLTDGTADWFWPEAAKAGIPVMFLTTGQLALFGPIAERNPQLILIIDHMGVSSDAMKNNMMPATIAEAAALAKYPNVSVKLSSVPLFSSEPYPFRDMTPHIRRLFDAYGPRRCYWGTDVTNSFAKASYRQRVTHFTQELDFLSEDDKDWIMGRAILERLQWA
ncbi:MAG TPA: amidohydrolase family protein [Xanthobacteraceae bacterium]|nr:amidohydrolase family protein [Xanthobacteraceae bacterium]